MIKLHWPRFVGECALVVGIISSSLSTTGCTDSEVDRCRSLFDSKQFEAAIEECSQTFARTGNWKAGELTATAHYQLGTYGEVIQWSNRCTKTAHQATLLTLEGSSHIRLGNFDLAEQAYRHAVDLHAENRDYRGESTASYGLFYVTWKRHQYRDAFLAAQRAYIAARYADDAKAQQNAIQGIFSVLYDVGDLGGAALALDAAADLSAPKDQAAQARILLHRAVLELDRNRPQIAINSLERAIDLGKDINSPSFGRSAHYDLVRAHLMLGDIKEAERHLACGNELQVPNRPPSTSALYFEAAVARGLQDLDRANVALETALDGQPTPNWAWRLHNEAGKINEVSGNLHAAETSYLEATHVVESLRASLEFDEFKSWLVDEKREPFESLFRIQAQRGAVQSALNTAERCKSRTFIDALVQATSSPDPSGEPPWASTHSVDRVDALKSLVSAMSESPAAPLEPFESLRKRLGNSSILYYFCAGHEIWLFSITGPEIKPQLLTSDADAVRELVSRFLAYPEEKPAAARLGEVLLPAGLLPERGKTLLIVPDGFLGELPFAALRVSDRYLVTDYDLAYFPSLNALASITTPVQTGYSQAMVITNGKNLKAAKEEAREVALLLNATLRIGSESTLGELRAAANAEVLHIASHTGSGTLGPWLDLHDGRAQAEDILRGRIRPRLVVLTSCSSAARRSCGLWGSLAATFLAAGSKSTVASLWSVQDSAARDFALRFFHGGGVENPAQAVAQAQRALIGEAASPHVWAPYVVFGMPNSVP